MKFGNYIVFILFLVLKINDARCSRLHHISDNRFFIVPEIPGYLHLVTADFSGFADDVNPYFNPYSQKNIPFASNRQSNRMRVPEYKSVFKDIKSPFTLQMVDLPPPFCFHSFHY